MADNFKPLGQAYPAAGVLTDLYVVPGGRSAIVRSVVVCNQGPGVAFPRLSVAVAGAADDPKQYIRRGFGASGLPPQDGITVREPITLAATDVLRCYSDTGQVSFNVFGDEIT